MVLSWNGRQGQDGVQESRGGTERREELVLAMERASCRLLCRPMFTPRTTLGFKPCSHMFRV
jgi:hypothetical protein